MFDVKHYVANSMTRRVVNLHFESAHLDDVLVVDNICARINLLVVEPVNEDIRKRLECVFVTPSMVRMAMCAEYCSWSDSSSY